jgi:hypothetical protein
MNRVHAEASAMIEGSAPDIFRLVAIFFVLAACGSPPASPTPVGTSATRTTTAPAVTPSPSPTAALPETAAPTATTAVIPTIEATALPTEVPPELASNLFAWLMGATSAPEGWTVLPCQGYPFALCVSKDNALVSILPMTLYPIETMPEFQGMLAEAGVAPGPLNLHDDRQMSQVQVALADFVEAYHQSIEADRAGRYGDQIDYVRQANESTFLGSLPGLRYGFAGIRADGTVYERWVSYLAFDGQLLYILAAPYSPEAFGAFPTDEDLQAFLPHLTAILTAMQLPLPVLETEVEAVRALRPLDVFRAYGESGNPVGQIAAGETVTVTGVSVHGQNWRIPCPDGTPYNCWITADATAAEPVD